MNLHRTEAQAQWESIDPDQRNNWQVLAGETNGIVTPANLVSVFGGGLVISGLEDIAHGETFKGLLKVGAGRCADILDGQVAEKTGTKSPKGEVIDATIDKIEMATALPILLKKDILSNSAFRTILSVNLGNTAVTAIAKKRQVIIHPSREGKLATFGQWTAIGLYGLASFSRQNQAQHVAKSLDKLGNFTLAASAALGVKALWNYTKDALQPIPT